VRQDLTRIDDAVEDGSLAENPVLREAFAGAERVHLLGLVSDGGVHSGLRHLRALIELGAALGVPDLVVHAFTDGRDTLPRSGSARSPGPWPSPASPRSIAAAPTRSGGTPR